MLRHVTPNPARPVRGAPFVLAVIGDPGGEVVVMEMCGPELGLNAMLAMNEEGAGAGGLAMAVCDDDQAINACGSCTSMFNVTSAHHHLAIDPTPDGHPLNASPHHARMGVEEFDDRACFIGGATPPNHNAWPTPGYIDPGAAHLPGLNGQAPMAMCGYGEATTWNSGNWLAN